jgi:tRNA(fMet)-specific endonuclease VapC
MRYLLDTNICIYIIRKQPLQVLQKIQTFHPSEIGISSITLSELEYGIEKSAFQQKNRLALMQFLCPFNIVPYEDTASRIYGKIRAVLESQGNPIGAMDLLIAAQAIALDIVLITNNEKEFRKVPDLKIENWVK